MALNFSHRPIFPAYMAEDNLVSPMRIANGYFVEGFSERDGGDGFPEVEECFEFMRDRVDLGGSPESVSKDILELLPSDPFGMDISSTYTAITGWLEDLEVDYGGYGRNNIGGNKEDYGLFAGLNWIWNKAARFQAIPANVQFDDKSNPACLIDGCIREKELGNALRQGGFGLSGEVEDMVSSDNGSSRGVDQLNEECWEVSASCSEEDAGAPHAALSFALSSLNVKDLLSVERVCRSLNSTVRSDPLLWKTIHIARPLNKINDNALLKLTSRAQGNLQCLSLLECSQITDAGLKGVLETNPRLTKLCVAGCTKLSIEGIVNSLKAFKSKSTPGIKHLRIGGLYGITHEHFEELRFLLGADRPMQQNCYKPHFYLKGNFYMLCDDDRAIDIEACPRCQKLRLVYDCPVEGCQGKDYATQVCRGCALCILRCVLCGRCVDDSEYIETFCLETVCTGCSERPLDPREAG